MNNLAVVAVLLISTNASVLVADEVAENEWFESPIALQVDSKLLNQDGKIMYPSPAVFDVDNDGNDELVIGSIFGNLYVCEDQSKSKGKHDWTSPVAILGADKKPLQLNNW